MKQLSSGNTAIHANNTTEGISPSGTTHVILFGLYKKSAKKVRSNDKQKQASLMSDQQQGNEMVGKIMAITH